MKRYLIGALVGSILLFGWQAVAHMFMHHHDAAYQKAPNSQAILAAMSGIKEEGQYMLPDMDVNATSEQQEAMGKAMEGKPWAMVTYHPSMKNEMGTAMIRSFSTAFICVLIFIAILGRNQGSLSSVFIKSLGLAFLMFMFVWYNQNIWMQTPWNVLQGELIDLLVAWGLVGVWLGWWLNRGTNRR
jgi:hypothetical protein